MRYEYPFECAEAGHRVWKAADWTKVEVENSLVLYRVEALASCSHCGTRHETITYAPARVESAE